MLVINARILFNVLDMKNKKDIFKLLPVIIIGVGLLAFIQTQPHWFRKDEVFWLIWLLAPGGMLYLYCKNCHCESKWNNSYLLPFVVLFGIMLLALASSYTRHSWFYFLRWVPNGPYGGHKAMFARLGLLSALLMPFFLAAGKRKPENLLLPVFVVMQVICLHAFWWTSGGKALYRIDHPSFMFRLFEFTRCFPQLVNYNPYWNGGTEHFVSVTSGTAGPGLLAYPILRFAPIHVVYTYVLGLIYIMFVPWMAYFSVRAVGGRKVSAAVGGFLALGVSQHFFLWMMHYGTIGAALSSAMILPVSALSFRVVKMNRYNFYTGLALVLSAFFLLLWPPGGIMGMAVAVAFIINYKDWSRKKWIFLIICAAATLLLYSHWLLVQLFEGNSVVKFVMTPAKQAAGEHKFWLNVESLRSGWWLLMAHIQEGHPLLIFFGLVGVVSIADRKIRNWFAPVIIVLALITGWGESWKHNSQLARMSIPMFFVAIVPASMLVGKLLRMNDARLALIRAILASLLILGAYNVSNIYSNDGRAPYVVLDKHVTILSDWIKKNVPVGGRVLFAGKCLHAFGGGNTAYLPILTGREMMADDYYGFPVGTIEYEYPPRRYRKSLKMMKLFFDTYNVTDVVTYHNKWQEFFAKYPDYFKKEMTYKEHNYTVACYSINRSPSMFLKGDGEVTAKFNKIDVSLTNAENEVVIKYNWLDHLKASDGVEIFPYKIDKDITLIGIHPNGKKKFSIIYRNMF